MSLLAQLGHEARQLGAARPALHGLLSEREPSAQERAMAAHVVKRVRLWKEVEPFYPDQTRGLPKSSESRGTEAVLNALVLAARDASTGTLSDEAKLAFANRAAPEHGAVVHVRWERADFEQIGRQTDAPQITDL